MDDLDSIGGELPLVARTAISEHLGEVADAARRAWSGLPRLPVFVTLRTANGALRGCVGSLTAVEVNVVHETARSAVLAATRDPRFPPVSGVELKELSIEVSVLFPEQRVQGVAELDPGKYGVVVRDRHGRRGLLLPDVPGVGSPTEQVAIARRKAGIPDAEPIELGRFEIRKFRD